MKDRTSISIGAKDWGNIDWKAANNQIHKLQRRIFRATQNARNGKGSWSTVRSLMKLVLKSRSALLLSIQKITQLNKGKKTPGIDGFVTIDNQGRSSLIKNWKWDDVKPTRRIFIPKANGKKRPLSIPTIKNRIGQAIMLLAYEPCFETSFEASSYGFRKGRSCHDAIEDIFQTLKQNSPMEYVLDADIRAAFDQISHEFLMEKLEGIPGRTIIKEWLKAGFVEEGRFHLTNTGVPQGRIISPLLSNIVLDGLQDLLSNYMYTREYKTICQGKRATRKNKIQKYQLVRYTDDLVVFSPRQEWLEEILPAIESWLKIRGLEINKEKTNIRNIRTEGFDFLGFHIQQRVTTTVRFNSLRYHRLSKKMAHSVKLNAKRKHTTPMAKLKSEKVYSCLITPAKKETLRFIEGLRTIIKNAGSLTFEQIITVLNSKLRGWGNYYRSVCSKATFQRIHHEVFRALLRLLKRRQPMKNIGWIRKTYFTTVDRDVWTPFARSTSKRKKIITLVNLAKDIPIVRHVKVTGTNSPFDPSLKDY